MKSEYDGEDRERGCPKNYEDAWHAWVKIMVGMVRLGRRVAWVVDGCIGWREFGWRVARVESGGGGVMVAMVDVVVYGEWTEAKDGGRQP